MKIGWRVFSTYFDSKGDVRMEKKSIVLNSATNDNRKGFVSATLDGSVAKIKVSLQGVVTRTNSSYTFLLKNNSIQHKFDITNPQVQNFEIHEFVIDKKISCLVIETSNGFQKPILWGGTDATIQSEVKADVLDEKDAYACESSIISEEEYFSGKDNVSSIKKEYKLINNAVGGDESVAKTNKKEALFEYTDDELEQTINSAMDGTLSSGCELEVDGCSNKKNTEEKHSSNKGSKLDVDKTPQRENKPYYYSLIEDQFDEMFNRYDEFTKLCEIIPNSKWVKIDGIDEPYVLGLIYDNNTPQYMCYGILQDFKMRPPAELEAFCQWLPLDPTCETDAGLWVMYQSCDNGETVVVEIV